MFIKSIDEICPEKEIRIKGRTESWIDIEILEAMRERDKALYKSNHNKDNPELRAKFNRLRNNVTKLIKKLNLIIFAIRSRNIKMIRKCYGNNSNH